MYDVCNSIEMAPLFFCFCCCCYQHSLLINMMKYFIWNSGGTGGLMKILRNFFFPNDLEFLNYLQSYQFTTCKLRKKTSGNSNTFE